MQNEAVRISFESKCIAYLRATYQSESDFKFLGPSTGFFWRSEDTPFLVTCRHCVTGRNSTNQPIKGCGDDPTNLQVYFRTPEKHELPVQNYNNQKISFGLWKDGRPCWREHPRGADVDIAALALEDFEYHINCINDKEQYIFWRPHAGDDCFIAGYPEGLGGSEGTPIWKRASIASEPELSYKGLPVFLCDTATRAGMSGSPVLARIPGRFHREGIPKEETAKGIIDGYWTKLIGIYAGREGCAEDGFQLGRAFSVDLIKETVENADTPTSPFIERH